MFYNLINSEIIFILVMILGFTCVIGEVFIPSLGLIGLVGFYLLINGFLAFPLVTNPLLFTIISLVVAILIIYILFKFVLGGSRGGLVLNTQVNKKSGLNAKSEFNHLLGKEGWVVKPLRPSGIIEVEGQEYDALSFGNFISQGEQVVVDKIDGSKIFCRRK